MQNLSFWLKSGLCSCVHLSRSSTYLYLITKRISCFLMYSPLQHHSTMQLKHHSRCSDKPQYKSPVLKRQVILPFRVVGLEEVEVEVPLVPNHLK